MNQLSRIGLLLVWLMGFGLLADPAAAAALQLWTRADSSLPLIREAASRFTARTGIAVEVSAPPAMLERFQALAQTGQGPDLLIWAHDRVGEWLDMGLLEPVRPQPALRSSLLEKGWQGFSRHGQLWGWPLELEAPSLILNSALLQQAPRTLDEVLVIEQRLQGSGIHAIKWDYMNAYYSWPMLDPALTALFPGGQLHAAGAAQPAVRQRLERLQAWMAAGGMPFTADYIDMEREFNNGRLAMMVAGPWAWDNLRRSQIKYTLAPVPGIAGAPAPSFVGVVGVMLSRSSLHKDAARKFVQEVLLDAGLQQRLYRGAGFAGVPSHREALRALWREPLMRQQARIVNGGVLMPNSPEMRRVWSVLGSALFNVGYSRQTPGAALEQAAARLDAR